MAGIFHALFLLAIWVGTLGKLYHDLSEARQDAMKLASAPVAATASATRRAQRQPQRPGRAGHGAELGRAERLAVDDGARDHGHHGHHHRGQARHLRRQQLHQGEPDHGAQRHRDGAGVDRGDQDLGGRPVRRQPVEDQRAQRDQSSGIGAACQKAADNPECVQCAAAGAGSGR